MDKEATKSSKTDFLQVLLKMVDDEAFTMVHLKALLMNLVVGGTDTSSNTTGFAMAEIINKPEIMKKAQQELDSVVDKEKIVEESDIPKLHYLYAILKETLRLHPAMPLLIPHCPSETVTVGATLSHKAAGFSSTFGLFIETLLYGTTLWSFFL
ncbi:unnamed protein product [Rhodiola kirilowii]